MMLNQLPNLPALLDHFKDESTCIAYLAKVRWNGNPCCIHCGSAKVYVTKRGYTCADKNCTKKFTVTTGTIMESTKLSLRLWFATIYIASAHKKGISSIQLAKDLGVTQKTAWFMMHRVRQMFMNTTPEMLTGTVEIDETYVGGKAKNKHANKKQNIKTGGYDKTPVLGMVERGGNIKTFVIPDIAKVNLAGIIKQHVEKGTTISTDEYAPYIILKRDYNHISVRHSTQEFVKTTKKGKAHTQTIDGYWSLLKRGIVGIYHQISPKHLHRYCNEFSYRYNTGKSGEADHQFPVHVDHLIDVSFFVCSR